MFCKSIVLLACLVGAVWSETSPLILYSETNSPHKATFEAVPQDEFTKIMQTASENSMILCFLETNLTYSDFSCSKSDKQGSCYSNLKGMEPKTYYAQVENPIGALKGLGREVKEAYVNEKGDLDRKVDWKDDQVVFVHLNSPNDDAIRVFPRKEVLEMHDMVMAIMSKKFSQKGKITTVYTSEPSTENISKYRRRRAAAASNRTIKYTWFRSNKDFLISFTELATKTPKADNPQMWDITPITIDRMEIPEKNDTAFSVNLIGKSASNEEIKLNFLISLSLGYFKMSKLTLNGESYYVPSEINAPTDFSYSCGNQTFTRVGDSVKILMWNSLQMQAPFSNTTKDDFIFGDAWYCVGFFSSGILAGLFVVFILLGIMSVGICWMLDINTMDRFDDPKGKTITINVNE